MERIKSHSSGSIHFFSPNSADQLETQKSLTMSEKRSPSPGKSCRTKQAATQQQVTRASSSVSSVGNTPQIKDWINKKSLQKLRDYHSAETFETQQMYNRVLDNETNFVKGIEDFLRDTELLNIRRKELLYKRWQEKVYIPIRKQVESTIEQCFSVVDQERRKEYLKYLNYKNKKGDVFLDVMSKQEYNPLTLNDPRSRTSLKARFSKRDDPLHSFERRRNEEDKTILRCETGILYRDADLRARRLPAPPLVPLGRHGTECATWSAMPLRDIESPYRRRSRARMIGKLNLPEFHFDEWSKTTPAPQDIDRELGIQYKRRFVIPSSMPSKDILENYQQQQNTPTPPVALTTTA